MNLTDDEIKTLVRSLAFRNNVGRIMEQRSSTRMCLEAVPPVARGEDSHWELSDLEAKLLMEMQVRNHKNSGG
jgi:hypothetical protein